MTATVLGGNAVAATALAGNELVAAQAALFKFAGKVSLGGAATPAAGNVAGGAQQASLGSDTLAGGTVGTLKQLTHFQSDSVAGGASHVGSAAVLNVAAGPAGVNAANPVAGPVLLASDAVYAPGIAHTISLGGHTSLTIAGLHAQDIIRPH